MHIILRHDPSGIVAVLSLTSAGQALQTKTCQLKTER